MLAATGEHPRTPDGVRSVYLHPGNLMVSNTPCQVETLLGSCVAVGVWDSETGVGGMNHFLLPTIAGAAVASPKFGNVAMERLLARVIAAGGRPHALKARIFGGASVLQALRGISGQLGRSNVDLARKLLLDAGIRVVSSDVEGERGRKVTFRTHDGAMTVRMLTGERHVSL